MTYKQEKPTWCTHQDCVFQRRALDDLCGGKLTKPESHNGDFNLYRLCIRTNGEVFDLQVNNSDLDWFRWIFDALDSKKTSFLSLDKKIQEINQQLSKLDANNPEYHRLHGYLAALSDLSLYRGKTQ